ncbi:MAG: phospholipid carrier-dependent glycosyltransferase [Nitrososphaerota archaeon]
MMRMYEFFQKYFIITLTVTILVIKLLVVNVPNPSAPPEACMDMKGEGCGFIFDEAHYILAVRKLIRGEAANNEHPPLSKFIIMMGMLLFGDDVGNAVGWRVFIAVFGAISVMTVGFIAQELSNKKSIGCIASLLFATDVMSFNLSSVAMLDAPAMTFSLIAVYFTLKKRYVMAGTFISLSLLCKLSFLNMVAPILIIVIAQSLKGRASKLDKISSLFGNLGKILLPAVAIFLFGLWVYDYLYGAFQTPFDHIKFMLNYHSTLKYTNSSNVDMPLSWINPISPFKPAPYYVETVKSDSAVYHPIAYWGIYSPLWWSIWPLVPVYIYKLVLNIKMRQPVFSEVLILSWVAFTYLPYFPIARILERWVFSFYFYTTVPALAIGISRFNEWGDWMATVLIAIISAQLVWFFIWFPVKNDVYITILRLLNLPA